MSSLMIDSQKIISKRLPQLGFKFKDDNIEQALLS
jgi:NAD dependent epimerase/dehydratase family enzyme